MKIELRSRLLPFSHVPGIECIVPFSDYIVQIFPTLLRFHKESHIEDITLPVEGPVKNFTVIQNLERGEVNVFGETSSCLIRYTICYNAGHLQFIPKKPFPHFFSKSLLTSNVKTVPLSPMERLHLGQHKSMDWELVKRRSDIKEILPVWHRLGQIVPEQNFRSENSLLQECRDAVLQRKKELLSSSFENLFTAGFKGMMVPRQQDLDYYGFNLPPTHSHPFTLLSEGAKIIRSLFITTNGNEIELLPCLPKEIISGKLCNMETPFGTIDFEWSKREPRRMIFKALASSTLALIFPKNIHKARLRLNDNDKGVMVNSGAFLKVEQGTHYYFDQFAY